MKTKILSLIAAMALTLAVSSMAKADTACPSGFTGTGQSSGCSIDLTVNNFLGGDVDVGTVTLTMNGDGTITVDIVMEPDYGIHNNGFGFNSDATLYATGCTLISPGTPTCDALNSPPPANNFDGFGSYDWGISISGTGGQANDPTEMSFTLTTCDPTSQDPCSSTLTDLSDIIGGNGTGSQNYFAAQVAYIPNTGCTGFAGNTGSTNPNSGTSNSSCPGGSTVPEPGSLMLFGTGLLGIAGFMRRKFLS